MRFGNSSLLTFEERGKLAMKTNKFPVRKKADGSIWTAWLDPDHEGLMCWTSNNGITTHYQQIEKFWELYERVGLIGETE